MCRHQPFWFWLRSVGVFSLKLRPSLFVPKCLIFPKYTELLLEWDSLLLSRRFKERQGFCYYHKGRSVSQHFCWFSFSLNVQTLSARALRERAKLSDSGNSIANFPEPSDRIARVIYTSTDVHIHPSYEVCTSLQVLFCYPRGFLYSRTMSSL